MSTSSDPRDLAAELRAAAAELVAERGPTAFSLREVARRAGVSHAAPAHHFGDTRGLLTAVATDGFRTLASAFDAAIDGIDDPVEQLTALGKAYVSVALEYPGHFGVICNVELVDVDDPPFAEASTRAYISLLEVMNRLRDALNPDLDVDAAATMAWSAVHGLASLLPSMADVARKTGTATAPPDQLIEQFTAMMVSGLAARPS